MAPRSQLPIILSVKRGKDKEIWRGNDTNIESSDEEFKMIRQDVLKLNRYACRFCGFESKKYQHVHHRDNDHRNNTKANLLVACVYCHYAHHVGFAGVEGGSVLIHFSARSQVWINHLTRLYFVSKLQQPNRWSKKIADLYQLIKTEGLRNLHTVYGPEMSGMKSEDPLWLANFLNSLDDKAYADRINWGSRFNSLRLLPVADSDNDRLTFWRDNAISPVEEWGLIIGDETITSQF